MFRRTPSFETSRPLGYVSTERKTKGCPSHWIVKVFNQEKADKIYKFFDNVVSVAHFGQSMLDYFALNDALEPPLAVVCQQLRQTENICAVLKDRHTTFLGLAQSFQSLKSHEDRDYVDQQRKKFSRFNYRPQSSARDAKRRRERSNPYRRGFWIDFQKFSFCSYRNWAFLNKCSHCASKNHGRVDCPRIK